MLLQYVIAMKFCAAREVETYFLKTKKQINSMKVHQFLDEIDANILTRNENEQKFTTFRAFMNKVRTYKFFA